MPTNSATPAHDIFALTDEQILEIEPETQDVEVSENQPTKPSEAVAGAQNVQSAAAADTGTSPEQTASAATSGPFSAAEDIRALAELYPGGLSQAKTAAERARTLDEIDAAYFGAAANSPEQVSAARAQLAQRMLSENPTAFREMVFAGIRALEADGATKQDGAAADEGSVAHPFRDEALPVDRSHGARNRNDLAPEGASYSAQPRAAADHSAYVTFERAANAELERSVGSAIERTIAQALPKLGNAAGAEARGRVSGFVLANPDSKPVPLQERLGSAVRQDVEAALKGDRSLGEQIAQVLAARRFDDATRAQVVRLIGGRAHQLVPGAARRVISEWTSATLAAHGAKSERAGSASSRREVAPAVFTGPTAGLPAHQSRQDALRSSGQAGATRPRSVDYRKLSDEQILDL